MGETVLMNKPKRPRCETTGKIKYRTWKHALDVLIEASRYDGNRKVPIRSYLCRYCNGIHLTSKTYL